MSGSNGPTVTLQTSLSPFVIAFAPPGHSPETVTSVALGARTRNVTVRSAWTSGEFGGGVNTGRLVEGAWANALNRRRQTDRLKHKGTCMFITERPKKRFAFMAVSRSQRSGRDLCRVVRVQPGIVICPTIS